jgi:hypothetical protein
LPTDGSTVNVRLSYTINSVVDFVDYSYTASNPGAVPEISSPVPGSTLAGDTVTFNWTDNSAGVTFWKLLIGTAPGLRDLHESIVFDGSVLSETVSGLPTDGSTVYVELRWVIGANPSDGIAYTYTAAPP